MVVKIEHKLERKAKRKVISFLSLENVFSPKERENHDCDNKKMLLSL